MLNANLSWAQSGCALQSSQRSSTLRLDCRTAAATSSSCSAHTKPSSRPQPTAEAPLHPDRRQVISQQLALAASTCFLQLLPAPSPAQAAAASDAIIPDDQVANAIFGNGSVVPAMSAEQYVARIAGSRGPAFRDLADLIDRSKYKELSEALFLSPFDDVMRSAFYLPW